jgi:hypothetical protein
MRLLLTTSLVLATAAGLSACTTAAPPQDGDLMALMRGASQAESEQIAARIAHLPLGGRENPVRADMPAGQRAYLTRLRCSDGRAPAFERVGSAGMSPYLSIMDAYQVTCGAGATPASSVIYIDMYRAGHVEAKPVPGFTIVAP